jgi:glutamine synthetase
LPYKRRPNGGYELVTRNASEVLEQLNKDGVKFVALQFTGLSGKFHQVLVPRRIIEEEMINEGLARLDGSSIKGFAEIQDSDLVLKPDPNTYAVVPWSREARRPLASYATYTGASAAGSSRGTPGTSRRGLRST